MQRTNNKLSENVRTFCLVRELFYQNRYPFIESAYYTKSVRVYSVTLETVLSTYRHLNIKCSIQTELTLETNNGRTIPRSPPPLPHPHGPDRAHIHSVRSVDRMSQP